MKEYYLIDIYTYHIAASGVSGDILDLYYKTLNCINSDLVEVLTDAIIDKVIDENPGK